MLFNKENYPLLRGYWFLIKNHRRLAREIRFMNISFSQFGEYAVLKTMLGDRKNGHYIDIGAFHSMKYSNTYQFYCDGWSGINIEPNPRGYENLKKLRPRDINLNLAISSKEGAVSFECRSALSKIVDRNDSGDNIDVIEVQAAPLGSVLKKYIPAGKIIDFMSVDCEGHDETVLKSNDWQMYRPNILLVEQHDSDIAGPISEFLTSVNYEFRVRVGLTLFFVDARTGSQ